MSTTCIWKEYATMVLTMQKSTMMQIVLNFKNFGTGIVKKVDQTTGGYGNIVK